MPNMRRSLAAVLISVLAAAACSGGDGSSSESPVEFTGRDATGAGGTPALVHASRPEVAPAPPMDAGFAAKRSAADAADQSAMQLPDISSPTSTSSSTSPSLLIRTGGASVEVKDIGQAIASVRQMAASLGGMVANTSVQSGRDQVPSAMLELKIPAARFDQAVNGLEPLGRVESVNVNAQDVGEEYVDVSARIANAKRLEDRLVTLLAARTGRLEDVLAVERELARIRSEIERYEARLRYLDSRITMSTLTVTVHEPYPVLGQPNSPITEAFRDAWRNFVGFFAWLIAASGILIPLGALLGAGWVLATRVLKGRQRRGMAESGVSR